MLNTIAAQREILGYLIIHSGCGQLLTLILIDKASNITVNYYIEKFLFQIPHYYYYYYYEKNFY